MKSLYTQAFQDRRSNNRDQEVDLYRLTDTCLEQAHSALREVTGINVEAEKVNLDTLLMHIKVFSFWR